MGQEFIIAKVVDAEVAVPKGHQRDLEVVQGGLGAPFRA